MEVALATSFFSLAQMICCPLLVRRSGAVGRGKTLCLCLAGATLGNVGIAMSPSVSAIVLCRFLNGAFAASVPVAQVLAAARTYTGRGAAAGATWIFRGGASRPRVPYSVEACRGAAAGAT